MKNRTGGNARGRVSLQARAARISAAAASSNSAKAALESDEIGYTGIQMVICAAKYDQTRSQDLPLKATAARALRSIAHANGAHLLYHGKVGAGRTGAAAAERKEAESMAKKLRVLIMHTLFAGHDRKLYAAPVHIVRGRKPPAVCNAESCIRLLQHMLV